MASSGHSPSSPTGYRPVRLGRWPWVLAVLLALFYGLILVSAVAVVGFFRIGAETRAVRETLVELVDLDKRIEVRAGWMTFGLARVLAGFVEDLPEEAGAFLSGLREVEVGVYEMGGRSTPRAQLSQTARTLLMQKNWDPVVYVLDGEDAVSVYTQADERRPDELRVCVLVLSDREAVLVTARANLAEFLEQLSRSELLEEIIREARRESDFSF